MSLKLEIVTPTGKVLDTVVNEVVAPGALGEFAVLPNHRPGIVLLGGGAIRFDGGVVFVRGGVAEISAERVLVLADEAVKAENAGAVNAAAILDKLATETAAQLRRQVGRARRFRHPFRQDRLLVMKHAWTGAPRHLPRPWRRGCERRFSRGRHMDSCGSEELQRGPNRRVTSRGSRR